MQTTALLLSAAADLSVVRLIRGAMRAADEAASAALSGGAAHNATAARGDRFEPRQAIHPTPKFAARPVYHPAPRFVPRQVIHLQPQVESSSDSSSLCGRAYNQPNGPIEPIWKKLPPVPIAQPAPVVKVIHHRPDIIHKGSLIDFFM